MQKGKTLENYLSYLVNFINSHGGHAHKNYALRTSSGQVVSNHGEPFDFEFFAQNKIICLDAKECSSEKLNIKSFLSKANNAKQFENFKNISRLNKFYVCGFLIYFINNSHTLDITKCLRFIEINYFLNTLKDGKKFFSSDSGVPFSPHGLIYLCVGEVKGLSRLSDVWDFLPNSKKEVIFYDRLASKNFSA